MAEVALPALAAAGCVAGGASAYVCDMNAPTAVVVDIFLAHGLPLLRPHASVVLTLKNFDGSRRRFMDNVATAVARVAAGCALPPAAVRTLHLLANGPDEVTLFARLPAAGGGERGGATGEHGTAGTAVLGV